MSLHKRTTDNWVLELTPEEGALVLALVDAHKAALGHKLGYDPECELCRAGSRISLGRDYGHNGLWPETLTKIKEDLNEKMAR